MSKENSGNGYDAVFNQGARVMVTALLMLIISTTFCLSPAMAGGIAADNRSAQRLVFASGPQGINLVSVDRVPSRRTPEGVVVAGALELSVIDKASGRTLHHCILADPMLVHADTVIDGALAGGPARLEDHLFSVVIPAVEAGQRIEISTTEAGSTRLMAALDGGEIEARESRRSHDAISGIAVETVYSSGDPANRLDILVLGDGYTESDMGLFADHVDNAVQGLLDNEPFNRFASFINVHKLEVASAESGTDQPDQSPPIFVDTAFNSSFNYAGVSQLLYAQTSLVLEAAAAFPEYDTILLIVNTARYGGGAGAYAVFAGGSSSAQRLMLHEFGHSFGGLTDEYQNPYDTYTGSEPSAPNCTAMGWLDMTNQQLKWHRWLGIEGVGLYEGCEYYAHGKFRPSESCLMRSLNADFDPVCREVMALGIFGFAALVDSREPLEQEVTLDSAAQSFVLRTATDAVEVEWFLDGELLVDGKSTQYLLEPAALTPGEHLLEAVVTLRDSWLLADPDGCLTQRESWTVILESTFQPFQVSLQVQADVTAGDRLLTQLAIENVTDSPRSFQASLDLIRCDGSRVNGFRRGSGNIQPGAERRINLPIHIPAQLPPQMLDCPLGLELVVADSAGAAPAVSSAGSFTIHAD